MKRMMYLLLLTLGLGLLAGCGKKEPTPEEVLTEYIALLNEGKYEEMYAYLSKEAQENVDRDTYVERYQNIYGGIEAVDIAADIEVDEERDEKSLTQRVDYRLTMGTLAGELSFDTMALFTKDEEGVYKMNWDSQDIFPGLHDTDKVRVVKTAAERGNIYDRNRVELAREGVASSVGIVPGKLPENREEALGKLAELLEISSEKIEKALSAGWVRDDTFVPLRTVSKEAYELKEQLLEIPGVMISDTAVRFYPFGEKAAQLTGYVQNITAEDLEERKGQGYNSSSIIGKAGAEKLYEELLRPRDGYAIQILNELGDVKDVVLEKAPEDGQDVVLTIDITLQQYLCQAMEGDEGCAVAMDPKTGEVLALVSVPGYDPNDFVMGYTSGAWEEINQDEAQPLYNRFLASWVPGSSFKPIVAAMGLTCGTLDPGAAESHGLSWQKDESWGDYYVTTLEEYAPKNLENALVYSDNIYFAKAALELGEKQFAKGLDALGFGETLEFDFALKASSYGSEGKISSETELADSGYGQGKLLVNPLHLSLMYSAFVNEGNMVKPSLLEGEAKGEWLKEGVFSPEAAQEVLTALYQVVENPNGTAHEAQRAEYRLAGKTGTAEIKDSKEDTSGTELGWFVGISEGGDQKPLLITMMIEDVKGRGGSHYVIPKVMTGFDAYMKGYNE